MHFCLNCHLMNFPKLFRNTLTLNGEKLPTELFEKLSQQAKKLHNIFTDYVFIIVIYKIVNTL